MSSNSQQISLLNLALLLNILLSQALITKAKSYSGISVAEEQQNHTNNQQHRNSRQQHRQHHRAVASVSDDDISIAHAIDDTKAMLMQQQQQQQQNRQHKQHNIAQNHHNQQQQQHEFEYRNTHTTKPTATLTTMQTLYKISQAEHQYHHHHQPQQQKQHKHQPQHEVTLQQHHLHQHYHHQEQHEHHQSQHPHLQTANPIVAHNKKQMEHQHQQHQHHKHQQQKHHSQTVHPHLHAPTTPHVRNVKAPRHIAKAQINNIDDEHEYNKFSPQHLDASDHLKRVDSSKDFVMDRGDIIHYDDDNDVVNYSYDDDDENVDDDFGDDYAIDDPSDYQQNDFGSYISRINNKNHKHSRNNNEHDHEYARITRDSNRFAYVARSDANYGNDKPYDNSDDQYQNDDPGVLTANKQKELGTPEAVKKSHENWTQSEWRQKNKKARDNLELMRTAYNCNKPMPMVVRISDDATIRYSPPCILMHRCTEFTGCCRSDSLVCRPNTTETVDIFVYGHNNYTVPTSVKVENHTSCHCVPFDNARDKRSPSRLNQQSMQRYQRQNTPNLSIPHRNLWRTADVNGKDSNAAAAALNSICQCPKHFNIFEDNKSTCYCDCLNVEGANSPCYRLKNGVEGFAVDDRKCITDRSCKAPTCTYGDYNRESGRCPHPLRNYRQKKS